MIRLCVAYGCSTRTPNEPVAGVVLCDLHLEALRIALAPSPPPSTAVVYYAWTPTGRPRVGSSVKIGYSANVHARMSGLGTDLLATEPGDRKLEAARHREFALLRIEREYFRPGSDLMAHVERLAGHPIERL
jgi:hypothetical protein